MLESARYLVQKKTMTSATSILALITRIVQNLMPILIFVLSLWQHILCIDRQYSVYSWSAKAWLFPMLTKVCLFLCLVCSFKPVCKQVCRIKLNMYHWAFMFVRGRVILNYNTEWASKTLNSEPKPYLNAFFKILFNLKFETIWSYTFQFACTQSCACSTEVCEHFGVYTYLNMHTRTLHFGVLFQNDSLDFHLTKKRNWTAMNLPWH